MTDRLPAGPADPSAAHQRRRRCPNCLRCSNTSSDRNQCRVAAWRALAVLGLTGPLPPVTYRISTQPVDRLQMLEPGRWYIGGPIHHPTSTTAAAAVEATVAAPVAVDDTGQTMLFEVA